jgi:hypothetical protein
VRSSFGNLAVDSCFLISCNNEKVSVLNFCSEISRDNLYVPPISKTHSLSIRAPVSSFIWVVMARTRVQMTTNIVQGNDEGFRLGNVFVSDQHGFSEGAPEVLPNGVSPDGKKYGRRKSASDH